MSLIRSKGAWKKRTNVWENGLLEHGLQTMLDGSSSTPTYNAEPGNGDAQVRL
jgi:hypothetical protein